MSQIKPFKAYRPKPEVVGKLASVPYDVLNTAEAGADQVARLLEEFVKRYAEIK